MMFVSLGIGAAIAVALIVVVSLLTGARVTSGPNALVGTTARAFTATSLDGRTLRAPWATGHPAVLVFFASWCGPCRAEMPKIASYLNTHAESPVIVMGIDALDARGAAQRFVRVDRIHFPIAFDPSGALTNGQFQFQTVPETVFVDAHGVVQDVFFGQIPTARLVKGIKALRAST